MAKRARWPVFAVVAVLSGGLLLHLHHRQQLDAAAQAERYAAWRNQREYRADSVACSLKFGRGGVSRATPFEADFRWHGLPAELATGSDDVEGETWAEFYDAGSAAAAQDLVASFAADLTHKQLRQRLSYLYFRERPDATDELAERWQPWMAGTESGWQVQIRWLATPHGLAEVTPPAQAPPAAPGGIVSELQRLGQLESAAAPWAWFGRDDPLNPDRVAYRDAREHALAPWRNDAARLSEFQQRFGREHRHFYLVEAARDLGGGHVLVLRRFGPILGPGTLQRAGGEIGAMIASLQCLAAERPSP